MADLEIIHETSEGYTHQGHSAFSADSYIKIRRSFRHNALRLLRGAPLSCFFEIALADDPPDVQTICANTGYASTATVCAALDFLVSRNFIRETGRVNGVKCYRAVNYAWSGPDRRAPQDIETETGDISNNEIVKRDAEKETSYPTRRQRVKSEISVAQTEITPAKSEIARHVHDDVDIKHEHKEETSIHGISEIEKILSTCFEGVNVKRLAARLDEPAHAQAWVDWCLNAATRKKYRNPQGIAYTTLMETRNAQPPFAASKGENAVREFRPGRITGHLAARFATREETA